MKFRSDFVTNSSSSSYITVLAKSVDGGKADLLQDSFEGRFDDILRGFVYSDNMLQFSYRLGNGKLCLYPVDTANKLLGLLPFSDFQRWRYDLNPELFLLYPLYKSGRTEFPEFYSSVCALLKTVLDEDWYPSDRAVFSKAMERTMSLCDEPEQLDWDARRTAGTEILGILREIYENVFDYNLNDEQRYGKVGKVWLGYSYSPIEYGYDEHGELKTNLDSLVFVENHEAHGSETDSSNFRMKEPYVPGKTTIAFIADHLKRKCKIKGISVKGGVISIPAGSSSETGDLNIQKILLSHGAQYAEGNKMVFPDRVEISMAPEDPVALELLEAAMSACLVHDYDVFEYSFWNPGKILEAGVLPQTPDVSIESCVSINETTLQIAGRNRKKNARSVLVDEGQRAVSSYEYYKNRSLKEAVIPDGVAAIGEKAFRSCTNLKTVVIPDSVESIGAAAFAGCSRLEEITIGGTMTALPDGLFSGCDKLKKVTINAPLKTIGRIFNNLRSLETVSLPAGLNRVSVAEFRGCANLKEIISPEPVIYVDEYLLKTYKDLKLPGTQLITSDVYSNIKDKFYESFTCIENVPDMMKYIDDLMRVSEIKLFEKIFGDKTGLLPPDTEAKARTAGMHYRRKPRNEAFYKELCSRKTAEDVRAFFEEYIYPSVTEKLEKRFIIAALLYKGYYYEEIQRSVNCSSSTVASVNRSLQYGSGGYEIVFTQIL